ncbi:FAD-dependent oxidoreductase [Streptomyces sp. NBC_01808]|uniref:FAD-dependent oxidoreductase n=1 Tax=Streptomyces sp. NBC_01808 TaxID=2975947 RepID=UPI002DDB4CC6|nr:FAD-dependent oxidoreductase [Streptomyces sp. NBC_01808]WSA41351.1 FAD-dependent oxidoreductase [Streptomyces sp. NBC_01808]
MAEKALSRRGLLAAGGAGLALPALGPMAYAGGRGPVRADLVVYGGTSAGVIAAVQMRRMGGTAVVLEPTRHIGGLTTSGLGATDTGNTSAIGGLALEFYRRVCRPHDLPPHAQVIVRERAGPRRPSSHASQMGRSGQF